MPEHVIRVLFRYRDLIARTLEEHRDIIAERGYCWWGWWKRPTEDERRDVWDFLDSELARGQPVVIGLFDSGAEHSAEAVTLARLQAIVRPQVSARGSCEALHVPAGEELHVPAYYRNSLFSRAWLKLVAIADQPEAFFQRYSYDRPPSLPGVRESGDLAGKVIMEPAELRSMDTTIWHVRLAANGDARYHFRAPSPRVLQPVSAEPVLASGDCILHLSDLHFAAGARRAQHVWGYPGEPEKTLADAIAAAVEEQYEIGLILVTGDITYLCDPREFEEARRCLRSLLGRLDLGVEHLVVIPGNHDLLFTKNPGERYEPMDPVELAPEAASGHFRHFYRELLEHDTNHDLCMGRRYVFPHGGIVDICALNSSCLAQGKQYLAGMGRVPPHAFADVRSALGWQEGGAHALRILSLHHHVTATEDVENPGDYYKGFGVAIDATKILREAARYGVHLILHGHRHRSFLWRSCVYNLPEEAKKAWQLGTISIVGGGSAGSVAVDSRRNSFNLMRITREELCLRTFISKDRAPFEDVSGFTAGFSLVNGRLRLGDWQWQPPKGQ